MNRHLPFGEPIEAVARDGIVCVFVDASTARDLANAWEFTYASGGLSDTFRPTYLLDVAALGRAATEADRQNGEELAGVRYVPLLEPDSPRLRLIAGGEG